jgi:hypothetical protein
MGSFRTWFEASAVTDQKNTAITNLWQDILKALGIEGVNNPFAVSVSDIKDANGGARGLPAISNRLQKLYPKIEQLLGADKASNLQTYLKNSEHKTNQDHPAGSGMLVTVFEQIFDKDQMNRLKAGEPPLDSAKAQVEPQAPVDQSPPAPDNTQASPDAGQQGPPPDMQQGPPGMQPPPDMQQGMAPPGAPGSPMPPPPDPNQPQPPMQNAHYRPRGKSLYEQWIEKRMNRR